MRRAALTVVGDDEVSLALIHLNLARRDYTPLVAQTAHVEQGWCPPSSPDLLVLDLVAPEPRCWEIAASVRALSWAAAAPLLLLTVCWAAPERLAALGVRKHIRKPFAIEDLLAAVEQILPGRLE